jgi:hypothetical protein
MAKVTMLATTKVTTSDRISVELHESAELPDSVLVKWPLAPSVSSPASFPAMAATVARLMATASTKLAQIRSRRL